MSAGVFRGACCILLIALMHHFSTAAHELSEKEIEALFGAFPEWRRFVTELEDERKEEPPVIDDGRPTEDLLREIEDDPFDMGYDAPAQILIGRGEAALPLVLKELESSDGYYRLCLIHIARQVSTPQRVQAFQKLLERLMQEEEYFVRNRAIETVLSSLGSDGSQSSIPLIERVLINESFHRYQRTAARLALQRLGRTAPHPDVAISYRLTGEVDVTGLEVHIEYLKALLALERLEAPVVVTNVDRTTPAFVVLEGTTFPTFRLKFGEPVDGRVPFYLVAHGSGAIGALEKRDGEWHLIYERGLWVS